jgi:hypothetical protein
MYGQCWASAVTRWSKGAIIAAAVAACEDPAEPGSEAARLAAVTPTSSTGMAGTGLVPAPVVRATDAQGHGVPGITVTFQVGSGRVAPREVTTDTNGVAAVTSWILGSALGEQRLTARAVGVPSLVFTATVKAGPVAQITLVSGSPQLGGVGQELPLPLRARVTDRFGHSAAEALVRFTVADGGGRMEGGAVRADAQGIATSPRWTLGSVLGEQHVVAESNGQRATYTAFAVAPPAELRGELAFARWSEDNMDLWRARPDGSGLTRLTTADAGDDEPVWSPDGSRIAYIRRQDAKAQLVVMTADGTELWHHADGAHDESPDWSPVGIAFELNRPSVPQIARIGSEGGPVTLVTSGEIPSVQPSWSPDGGRLVFGSFASIYTVDADGTHRTIRTPQPLPQARVFLHPAWSPDGTMIAFVYGESLTGGTRFRVAVMTADGTFLKDLARAGDLAFLDDLFDPGSLTWSPDGRGIAYSRLECDFGLGLPCSYEPSVKYVSLDGRVEHTLIANAQNPSWRP